MSAADEKRAEVIERATRVFSEKGFRATSMNDIADAAGLSKSALYHYFAGKEDLLVAIYDAVLHESVEASARIEASSFDTLAKLRQMLIERVVYACENQRIIQVFYEEEAELSRGLLTRVVQSRRAYTTAMTKLIERGVEEGIFRADATPHVITHTFLGATNWPYKWFKPDGPLTSGQLGEEMTDLLLRSIVADDMARPVAVTATRALDGR